MKKESALKKPAEGRKFRVTVLPLARAGEAPYAKIGDIVSEKKELAHLTEYQILTLMNLGYLEEVKE